MAISEIIEIAKQLIKEKDIKELDAIKEAEKIVNEREKEKYEKQ